MSGRNPGRRRRLPTGSRGNLTAALATAVIMVAVVSGPASSAPVAGATTSPYAGRVGKSITDARVWGPASAPSVAAATPSPYAGRVGVSSHLIWLSEPDAQAALAPLAAGGVTWVREDFPWDQLQPSPTRWDWSRSDNLMQAASRTGVNVLAILDYSAPWASSDPSGGGDTHFPPLSDAAYADYAHAVVARYGVNGAFWAANPGLRARPLGAIEIWNEAYGWWNWKPAPNPAAYAALVRAAAAAARVAQPTIPVLADANLLEVRKDGAIVGWLDSLLSADPGLGKVVSAFAIHPYPDPPSKSPMDTSGDPRWTYSGNVALVRRTEALHGVRAPLWITEIGWTTATGTPDGVTEAEQARYVTEAVSLGIGEWGGFVQKVFVYSWDESTGTPGDTEGNYGLRRADGSFKPAWPSLVAMIAGH
jgi:hypothetical protein